MCTSGPVVIRHNIVLVRSLRTAMMPLFKYLEDIHLYSINQKSKNSHDYWFNQGAMPEAAGNFFGEKKYGSKKTKPVEIDTTHSQDNHYSLPSAGGSIFLSRPILI